MKQIEVIVREFDVAHGVNGEETLVPSGEVIKNIKRVSNCDVYNDVNYAVNSVKINMLREILDKLSEKI